MIKSVSVTNYLGSKMTMILTDPVSSGFAITEIEGLGPAKADIHTTDVATNDGSIYNSARVNNRNIVLSFRFVDERLTAEEIRLKSYKFFPIKSKVTLTVETDNRIALIDGYVESNEPKIFSQYEETQISIICTNPYFQSYRSNVTVFSGMEPKFEFPFENNSLEEKLMELGTIENRTARSVYYDGDAEVGVVITIHALGTVENITIYNLDTRESMSIDTDKIEAMTGSGIVARDDIIISTVKGQKRITLLRDGIETNILNCLNKDADWFQLAKGDNMFTYVAEYGNANLQFKVTNQILYEGI